MKIGELKKILEEFEDDKTVDVFLNFSDIQSKFGIVYDIIYNGNNYGHLNLWIEETVKNMTRVMKEQKK